MSTLAGKRVWITGASKGIGAALAAACRLRGAKLVLSARSSERLHALAESLGRTEGRREPGDGTEILVLPLDVSRPDDIASAAERVGAEAGPVDVVVHAAGVSQRATAMETEADVLRRIFETNFFSAVALTRELLSTRAADLPLHIVAITSAFGKFGAPGRSAYAASKHALHGYFDSLRTELAPERARVTLVVPGAVATEISTNALRGDGTKHGVAETTIARGMSPEECARRIVRAIERNRDEIRVGTGLRLRIVYLLKSLAPRLLTRILRTARIT